jgi:F-box/leucine-rich repeat protein 2/20
MEFLIQKGSDLKVLILKHPHKFSSDVAACIAKICPRLEKLSGRIDVNDTELILFGKNCPKLTSLILYNSTAWTDIGVIEFAKGCRQLTELIIYSQYYPGEEDGGVTDVSILKVTEFCQMLKSLSLHGLPDLTDESLYAIERNCKSLTSLTLNALYVSNTALKTLFMSPNMKCLVEVYLRSVGNSNNGIDECNSDDVILELVKNTNATLTVLEIEDCASLTETGICHIANHCTHLQKLVLTQLLYVLLPTNIAEILKRNPQLVQLYCGSLGPNKFIVDNKYRLIQTLLDENIKNSNIEEEYNYYLF